MAFSIKNIFGNNKAAAGETSPAAAMETGAVYFEILTRYSNRMRPLGDHVKFDAAEENRLRALRADAYAARHGYASSDVFMEYPYERVDPDHVIKSVTLKPSAPKKLPEFSAVLHTNVVSDRVRKGIESLEPGKHAFYPLDVVSSDGTEIHKYHFIQYLEKTDCVDRERSGYGKGVRDDGSVYWFPTADRKKVFLKEACVGGRHLFWDKGATFHSFISGALVERLGDFLPAGLYLDQVAVIRESGN